MPAPTSVIVNPGVVLIAGTAGTGTGITYTNGANGQARTRVTSLTLCDKTLAGVWVTVKLGNQEIVHQYALPTDGSPLLLAPNESISGSEQLAVIAQTGTAVDVRATGEEIFA